MAHKTLGPRPEGTRGKGTLIIVGGHEEHEGEREILKEVAKHVHNKRLVLSTIASHKPEGDLEKYQATFADLGMTELTELYLEDRSEAAMEEKLSALDGVEAVLFPRGNQLRITSQIGDTAIEQWIHEIFQSGGLIAGTSAGASIMADTILVKGQSAASFRIGEVRMAPELRLLPNVIIDQHFAERGLIGAVSQNPRVLGIGISIGIGIGIDEDTAIVVEGTRFRVIGSGAVYLVDASDVTHSNVTKAETAAALSIYDLRLQVLGAGDTFGLETRRPESE